MGIKNLLVFLRQKCPTAFETTHLENYKFQKIAIDTPIFMYKFKVVNPYDYLSLFARFINTLRYNDIHPIFVFDGDDVPNEKLRTRQRRQQQRNSIRNKIKSIETDLLHYENTGEITPLLSELYNNILKKSKKIQISLLTNTFNALIIRDEINRLKRQVPDITPGDVENVKKLLEITGIPYITASGEAERMCATLKLNSKVDGIITEDSDVLAYGSSFISKIDTNEGACITIHYDRIIKDLQLNPDTFLDLCIMMGNDYNDNLPGIGSAKSYKLLCTHSTIDNVLANGNINEEHKDILNHKRTREIFNTLDNDQSTNIRYCKRPDPGHVISTLRDGKIKIDYTLFLKNLTEPKHLTFIDGNAD